MGYQKQQKKKHYSGDDLIPLTVQSELLKRRDSIESGSLSGADLELAYQAYVEIEDAFGRTAPKLDRTCGDCINTIQRMVRNWMNRYDQRPYKSAVKTERVAKTLNPKVKKKTEPKAEPKDELSYKEIKAKFDSIAPKSIKKTINNGKPPKKQQMIDYLLNPTQDEKK